jgi:hypothetical protein
LYQYDQREAVFNGKSKLDKLSGQFLNNQQQVFRNYEYNTEQTTYFYRTNETLVGKVQKPHLIKKNYRLATRALNPLKLLKLASQHSQKSAVLFKKPKIPLKMPLTHTDFANFLSKKTAVHTDFQEFLITNLLTFCHSAEFINLPLE